jgi:hypothetical protein
MKLPTPAILSHRLLCLFLAALTIISFFTLLTTSFNSAPAKTQNLFGFFTLAMLILYLWHEDHPLA